MRRLLSFICCLTLCVLCVCPTVTADDTLTYGDFTYENYRSHIRLESYFGTAEELVLPAEINGVPVRDVFLSYTGEGTPPRRVVVPEGVEVIGKLFDGKSLEEVVLPQSLYALAQFGDGVFEKAENLKTLTIPRTTVLIVNGTFHENITLKGEADSYIARWAAANGYKFEAIDPVMSPGDVNGDRVVNSTDARLLLQYFTQSIDEDDLVVARGDIDGNGEVDSTDARLALQYFVGSEKPASIIAPSGRPYNGEVATYIPGSTAQKVTYWTLQDLSNPTDIRMMDAEDTVERINRAAHECYGYVRGYDVLGVIPGQYTISAGGVFLKSGLQFSIYSYRFAVEGKYRQRFSEALGSFTYLENT